MKVQLKKIGEGMALVLPGELARHFDTDEAEVFMLRDGICLLAPSGKINAREAEKAQGVQANGQAAGKNTQAKSSDVKNALLLTLSNDEQAVARKLIGIKFEMRQMPQVEKMLNAPEKKALGLLITKKLVGIMKSAKYPKGVYGISDPLYEAMRGAAPEQRGAVQKAPAQQYGAPTINSVAHLKKFGYMILDNENEAKSVTPNLQGEVGGEEVKGVRGFDKKYYVLLRTFYLEHEAGLLAMLDKSPKTAEAMAPELKLTPEAVRTLLLVLADDGEVIEKQKGVWQRA